MDYSFNVELAEKYGVEEAVLLQHLYFWIQKNAANGKHFHDGHYWTYNSARAFSVLFPFWKRQKIDRLIQSLRERGAILVGNYNDVGRDRTRWFALSETVCAIAENRAIHCSKVSNHYQIINQIEIQIRMYARSVFQEASTDTSSSRTKNTNGWLTIWEKGKSSGLSPISTKARP